MPLRNDREDTSAQQERLRVARVELAQALDSLAAEAKIAARVARSKAGQPDLPAVYAESRNVERAEQDVDIATHDLATARGEDA